MPELEDIVQRIALSGQDDVVAQFGEIGKAGTEAFKKIGESAGELGGLLGGLAGAFAGLIGATGAWAHHSAEAAAGIERLAQQSGESIESISALQSALSELGGSSEGLGQAFQRMGTLISGEWDRIKKQVADASDIVIADNLKVDRAEEAVWKAQQARKKAAGETTASPEEVRRHARIEATTAEEAAEHSLHEAQKKRNEDRLNSVTAYGNAVKEIFTGEKNFTEASKDANLSVENVIKGLIVNTKGAQDALENFHGGLNEFIGTGPKTKEVLYNLADFLKNSGNAALNAALQTRLLGRGLNNDLIVPLSRGSAVLKEAEERAQKFGLVITEGMNKPGVEFAETFNRLSHDLSITSQQIGLMFAPVFTKGLQDFTGYIEQNHQALLQWGSDLVGKVTPYIQGFFDSLKGLAAFLAGDQLNPESAAGKWEATWERVSNVVKRAAEIIQEALNGIKSAIAAIFGGEAGNISNLEAIIGGIAAWKLLGGKAGAAFVAAFLASLAGVGGGGGGLGDAIFSGLEVAAGLWAVKAGARFVKDFGKQLGGVELPGLLRGGAAVGGGAAQGAAAGVAGGAVAGTALSEILLPLIAGGLLGAAIVTLAPKVWEALKSYFKPEKEGGLPEKAARAQAEEEREAALGAAPGTALTGEQAERLRRRMRRQPAEIQGGRDIREGLTRQHAEDIERENRGPGANLPRDQQNAMLDLMIQGKSAAQALKEVADAARGTATEQKKQKEKDLTPRLGETTVEYKARTGLRGDEGQPGAPSAEEKVEARIGGSLGGPPITPQDEAPKAVSAGPVAVDHAQINAGPVTVQNATIAGAAQERAEGGAVHGWGSGKSDSVPIMASVGEYVVRADGSNLGAAIAHFAGYAEGGKVGVEVQETEDPLEKKKKRRFGLPQDPDPLEYQNQRTAAGSQVDTAVKASKAEWRAALRSGFAGGGLVGGFANAIKGYAEGGRVSMASSPSAASMGHHELDIRTNAGQFTAKVDTDTMEAIRSSSLGGKLTTTGSKPTWWS